MQLSNTEFIQNSCTLFVAAIMQVCTPSCNSDGLLEYQTITRYREEEGEGGEEGGEEGGKEEGSV